ncbi:Gfo/Idh/MocA family protein [Paenibacillus lignilyticus]|uniref:Gfo/Idh/MocA family oxidoreductase n=1 Tax=Paenibacillus lignilyticus TaxID=1172615 RepID=A0ABS5CCA6_9BACL|nr:Gfo/Idh/MocA family oxidoreductase [Paenibacillus lignilyticus]MBP3961740.1 Gfo/Idh/MocA family oxidoreductase [Paenibacillus lignilyticus]MBP3963589.1 Gfo/Idh/MocA family oxidoreductase [Paenibacillus lignilyticus]
MRFYLIGAGVINRTHAEAIYKIEGEEVIEIKVADPNPAALASFAERFPQVTTFTDAKEMLNEEPREDDIVIVGTPPFTHFPLSRMALESGRHTLCEKPLVMNREEAEALLEIAKANNRMLGCCSVRFLQVPKTDEVKRILNSGELGDVYKISFVFRGQRGRPGIEHQPESRWFLDKSKAAGGIVMDWGPYDFTLLNDMLQPVSVEVASAWTAKPETDIDPKDVVYDIEGHVGAMLKFQQASGKSVWVQYERASCTHGEPYYTVEIEGTNGAVKWSPYFETDQVLVKSDKNGEVITNENTIPYEGQIGYMDHPIHFFYQKVKGQQSPAVVNEQAVFNFLCLQSIYDAAASQQAVVLRRK